MERIGIFDARARFSELIGRVEAGEEVVLTRHGKPVVRLIRAGQNTQSKSRAAAVRRIRSLSKTLDLKIGPKELKNAIAAGRD